MSTALQAVVVAPATGDVRVTGVRLSERGRRVCVRAGVATERIHVVRTHAELAALALADDPLLIVHAHQVVAGPLVEPLRPHEPGGRAAFDTDGYAGALRVDRGGVARVVDALARGWDLAATAAIARDLQRVEVGRRARHAAGTRAELRAATRWQFELVNKPLDAFMTRRFWRPIARPFTKLFVELPFSPNAISIACLVLSVIGAIVAAGPTYREHVIGIAILFASAIADNVDGEVARLRLEMSTLGGWLDTIGDDVARIATIVAVGMHASHQFPDWPLREAMWITLAATLIAMGLVYWWCVFVGKTFNNQDYTQVMGVGPGIATSTRTWKHVIGELCMQAVRRDFIDFGVIVLALFDASVVSLVGLALGSIIGVLVTVPVHVKIVRRA